jgi:ABC-type lipoprotein export system ATPase subunit
LDQSNAQRVVNLIKDLHQEVKNTIILITHDMEIAKQASLCFELINKNFIKHK